MQRTYSNSLILFIILSFPGEEKGGQKRVVLPVGIGSSKRLGKWVWVGGEGTAVPPGLSGGGCLVGSEAQAKRRSPSGWP